MSARFLTLAVLGCAAAFAAALLSRAQGGWRLPAAVLLVGLSAVWLRRSTSPQEPEVRGPAPAPTASCPTGSPRTR